MKRNIEKGFFIVWAISVFYGALAIPIDFLISLKSNPIGFIPAILLAFRSCGLIMLMVALFTAAVFILLRILDRAKPNLFEASLQQAILIVVGVFVVLFLLLFDKFYNKSGVLVAVEVIGGAAAIVVVWISYLFLQTGNRSRRLAAISPKVSIIGTLVVVILYGISFIWTEGTPKTKRLAHEIGNSDRPNILLIVMDTVRADHLSVYGYNQRTTPFLEKFAEESAVFNNAYAASPWTLPSHASFFTGLYPSQHNTHAEHMWLDNSFHTLAEMLYDNGYQTISFSNNDYVSSYHNLVQGFEHSWYKGGWTDDIKNFQSLGGSAVSFFNWFWKHAQIHILAKLMKNPASIADYPNAATTNKAISEWLDHGRDESRPFFIFINYMDAHLPYNPNDETARLFLSDEELNVSYRKELRFPPTEYCLDLSKGGYTETDIRIITSLYDACIHYLDGELEKLFKILIGLGIYDETLIIVTSDHGEYLGTRNRFAHGLGLHDEVLHVPLIIHYPTHFKPGSQYDTPVTHIDIHETILSFASIKERPNGKQETQLLFDLKGDYRTNVFAEFRFPLHVLITSSLLEDNSNLFVEQKTIHSRIYQFIWKSRGEPEFYNVVEDPQEVKNLYSNVNEIAQNMSHQLVAWSQSLYNIPQATPEVIGSSKKEKLELLERLRGIGYIK